MYIIEIPIGEVKEGMKIASPVFSHSGSTKNMIICRKETVVTNRIINLLNRHEILKIEVYSSQNQKSAAKMTKLHEENKTLQINPILPMNIKHEAINSIKNLFNAVSEPGELVNLTTAHQLVRGFEKTLSHVVAAATSDLNDMIHIFDLKSHDEYTYHHSISVALLSVATGQSLGFDLRQSMNLGRSALLHDIGKQFIPASIINKRGKLTKEEFAEMMSHPSYGASNLKAKGIGGTGLLSGILFHHEKINGSGYPKGLAGNEIPISAKIVAVADVFDALTSYRSYRNPMTPTAAYEVILNEVGTSFDYSIVEAFIKKLDFYPINSALELSNGQIVYVVENQNALRPVVADKVTNEKLDLASPKNSDIMIVRVADKSELITAT